MAGVFPNETSIYIAAADTVGSAAATAGNKVVGEITNWALSGGEQDIESIPVIGGFVDKENPTAQFEFSMDVIVSNASASTLDRYDTLRMASGSSANEGAAKAIFISAQTGSLWKTFAFNNCRTVTWEPTMAADDMLRGTISFKFSPTTSLGAANLKTSALAISTSFWSW